MMDKGEHKKLHTKLRQENKCDVPAGDLAEISRAAHIRSPEYKKMNCNRSVKSSEIYSWDEVCV